MSNSIEFPGKSRDPIGPYMQIGNRTFVVHPQTLDLSRDPSEEPYLPFIGRKTGRFLAKHLADIPEEMRNYVFAFPHWNPSPWDLARDEPLLKRLGFTAVFSPLSTLLPSLYEMTTLGRSAHIWWDTSQEEWRLGFLVIARPFDYVVTRFSPDESHAGIFAGRRLAFVQQL